jgi:ABC-type multidrug transport system fused ATPase/permease subunit
LREIFKDVRAVLGAMWAEAGTKVRLAAICAAVFVISASTLTALAPLALKAAVDRFSQGADSTSPSPLVFVALYVVCLCLGRMVGALREFFFSRGERRFLRKFSERCFAHFLRLPLRYRLDGETGSALQVLQDGMQGCQLLLQVAALMALPIVIELGTALIVLLGLHEPVYLGFVAAAFACYALAFAYSGTTVSTAARQVSESQLEANAATTDALMNFETVKYMSAEPLVEARVKRALASVERGWMQFSRRVLHAQLAVVGVYGVFVAATTLYAARQVSLGDLSIGSFVLINAYLLQLVGPAEAVGVAVQRVAQALAYLAKLREVLQTRSEALVEGPLPELRGAPRLEFAGVSLSFRPGRFALRDVSFAVAPGQILGIVGANGAGKSSLVRVLARLMEPDSGEIRIDGESWSRMPLSEVRRAIAVVPQDVVLFTGTIRYNIQIGNPEASQAEIEHAAQLVDLHEFIQQLPAGYDTQVGERGRSLSGGERQRLSIARAVVRKPSIFVFDEPTSALDAESERQVLECLFRVSKGGTALVIAHSLRSVRGADAILVLDHGEVCEFGTHADLLRRRGKYSRLWEAQQGWPQRERVMVDSLRERALSGADERLG